VILGFRVYEKVTIDVGSRGWCLAEISVDGNWS